MSAQRLFAIAAPGLEPLVAAELKALAAAGLDIQRVEMTRGGVRFEGDPLAANRHLRIATRVIQRVAQFKARRFDQLIKGAQAVDWSMYGGLTPEATCRKSKLYHSGAVESRLAEVVPPGPVKLMARLDHDVCTLSVDTSGERLHKRGWRLETGAAPLRETLACALLRLAHWQPGEALYDPMCGSGTFLIEAARWAMGTPPGADRSFACEAWWSRGEAQLSSDPVPTIFAGSDRSQAALQAAQRNAERAGVRPLLSETALVATTAKHARPPAPTGLVVCNPPYGQRVGQARTAMEQLSAMLSGPFAAWRAAVLVPLGQAKRGFNRPIVERTTLSNGGQPVEWIVLGAG